jgi:hypothetical protein
MSQSTDETIEEPIDGDPVEDINEPSDPPPKKEKRVVPMIKVPGFVDTKPISYNNSTLNAPEIKGSRYW